MRRRIRGNRLRANTHTRPVIRSAGVDRAARKHDRRQSEIGPAINREVDLAAENFSIPAHGSAVASARRMPLRRSRHVFHAVVNNFHWPSRLHRQQRSMRGDHRRIFFLAAESASGLHLHDANFFRRQIAKGHQRFVNVIRTLQRAPHRDPLRRDQTPRSFHCFRCKAVPARRSSTRLPRCSRPSPIRASRSPFSIR